MQLSGAKLPLRQPRHKLHGKPASLASPQGGGGGLLRKATGK
jgi:hypothetical protein